MRLLKAFVAVSFLIGAGSFTTPTAQSASTTNLATTNWAGYQVNARNLNEARATWTVPSVTWSGRNGYSAQWVGLGGGTSSHDALIQAGTGADVVCTQVRNHRCTAKSIQYWTWIETFPTKRQERINNLSVKPGDTVTTTVGWDAHQHQAKFTVCNWSTPKCVTATRPSSAPGAQAEIVLERPATQNLMASNLATFTPWKVMGADFSVGTADMTLLQLHPRSITMKTPRTLATPSSLVPGTGAFTVTRAR